jgi:hypothetical protein
MGQFNQALAMANTIEKKNIKSWALASIAAKQAEAGQKEKAAQLLSQAVATAITVEKEHLKDNVLVAISDIYAEMGQFTPVS